MYNPFTKHPQSQGLSYLNHLVFAWCTGFALLGAALAAFAHGLLPFCCQDTTGNTVKNLYNKIFAHKKSPKGEE